MDGDAGIGCARAAGHETDSRCASRFGVTFGHEARTAFLPIGDQFDFRHAAQTVQYGDVTFSRHTEYVPYAFVAKTLSDCMITQHTFPLGLSIIFSPQ